MSEQKKHQLMLLFWASCAVVALMLLLLAPILCILWLLLVVFVCVLLAKCRPAFWQAEKAIWVDMGNGIRRKLFAQTRESPAEAPVLYELAMVKPSKGRRYPIDKKVFLIGRGSQCDCRLSHTATIGREHCRIIYREHSREYYIEDLRSKNGTYLGTRRLEPNTQVKLLENAELFIGDCCLRFQRR